MLSPGRSGSESVWGVGENLGKWENRGDWATLIKSRIFKDRVRLAVFMAYLVCVCARFMFAHFHVLSSAATATAVLELFMLLIRRVWKGFQNGCHLAYCVWIMSQKGPFGRPNFVFVYCGFICEMVALLFANGGLNVVRNVVRNGKLSDLLGG